MDYTAIVNRLGTVSWSNESHPTGVVKPVYRIPTNTNHKSCVIQRTHTWNFVNKSPYKNSGPTANQGEQVIKSVHNYMR